MQDFDGDSSKVANHRNPTKRQPAKREFRQEYECEFVPGMTIPMKPHTGGLVYHNAAPLNLGDNEHRVPTAAAEKLRKAVDELRKENGTGRGEKSITMTIQGPPKDELDSYLDRAVGQIVQEAFKKHVTRVVESKLWEMCGGRFPFMIPEQPHRLVILESPLAPTNGYTMDRNQAYARECMRDSLKRGEAPYASHLLYTHVLDDLKTSERKQGMEAGFAWGRVAQHVAVYIDHGVSKGMLEGIKRHQANHKTIEFRSIK